MTAKGLAEFYKTNVRSAYYHAEGNWYWSLKQFPGAYFDGNGCVVFQTEQEYRFCGQLHLSIGPKTRACSIRKLE